MKSRTNERYSDLKFACLETKGRDLQVGCSGTAEIRAATSSTTTMIHFRNSFVPTRAVIVLHFNCAL